MQRNQALLLVAVGLVPAWAMYLGLGVSNGRGAGWAVVGAIWWLVVARRSGWPGVPWGVFFRAWLEWALILGLIGGGLGPVAGWVAWDAVELGVGMGAAFGFRAAAVRVRQATAAGA